MTVQTLELKPAAAEILRSPAKVKVVNSGRRFGKTRMALVHLVQTSKRLQIAGVIQQAEESIACKLEHGAAKA